MTPIWKIASGRFAGWYSNDAVYDAQGRHVGFLAGTVAYGHDGSYMGEIYKAGWIGRAPGLHKSTRESRSKDENVAHAPLEDRPGLGLEGWQDPELL